MLPLFCLTFVKRSQTFTKAKENAPAKRRHSVKLYRIIRYRGKATGLHPLASAEAETADDGINQRLQEARARLRAENRFWRSVITWLVICAGLGIINVVTDRSVYWFLWPLCLWGGLLLVRGARLFVLHEWLAKREQQRLQQLLKK